MTIRRSLPVFVVALLAALVAVLSVAPEATAGQKPCWQRLIDDWYDGTIDKTYPVRCYREAQRHIPEDAEMYSDLPADLDRALQAALNRGDGGPLGPDTPVEPVPGTGRDLASRSGGDGPGSGGEVLPPPIDNENEGVIGRFRPSNADSIPIPLLVLAALAMLLLAAAAASFIARRLQARRAPATSRPRPRAPGS